MLSGLKKSNLCLTGENENLILLLSHLLVLYSFFCAFSDET